jgi:hypothetical protein
MGRAVEAAVNRLYQQEQDSARDHEQVAVRRGRPKYNSK